ncbi:MAG: cation:proton antiporter, partial [Proteobacteria bacterium]|nr:cation:proton antiporter [Pseudomonadota bacterium]
MHTLTFLQDLAVVMIVAGLVTVVFHRFRQPVVLGYILAGMIIGPHTPPYALVHDEHTIHTLSELGLILLMFSLGLEFSLRKLTRVGASAFIAALMEILLMLFLGYETGRLFGWSRMDSIFLGAILSISSTTIIIKALHELGKSKERFAELIFGVLIIEDLLGIAMITLLSGIAMTGTVSFGTVGVTLGKLGLFLAVTLVLGLITVPRLIGYVARFKSNEMLLVTILGLCFGVSLLALKLGYSVALGAFLIGAVIAEAREIHKIETLIAPIRDMFSAVFFVAIGLLIDPQVLGEYWLPVLTISAVVVVGKVLACSFGAFLGGHDPQTSLRVGTGLAQIGEFSFIIASLGLSLNVTGKFLYPIAVAVSALTTLTTPYLIQRSDGVITLFDRLAPRPLVTAMQVYTRWTGQLGGQHRPGLARQFVRKWVAQMALNVALTAALFLAAVPVAQHPPAWLQRLNLGGEGLSTVLWFTAVVLSLPLLIATFRKLQALGLLLAETRVNPAEAGERTEAIRSFISQVVPVAGGVALGLYVLLLSAPLLPPLKMLVLLLLVVGLVAWRLRRMFIKIYSKAQNALHET